ncbi:MAG: methylcrotonoyl-CoA carboxylase [Gammaproteobacteria bacterium]|nr:methylcrotonoyl-CoA carboxylase [Gammaproteobacteria bacterium]
MPKLDSKIDVNSEQFKQNKKTMTAQINLLEKTLKQIHQGGSERSRQRQLDHGKILVHERIAKLIDEGSEFLELSQLAGHNLYQDISIPAAGIITGIGEIHGQHCMIVANDPTVKGGTYFPITVKKHLRAQEIAEQNHLPCIYLVDSGGAFLPFQDKVFPDRDHFGRIFFNQANLSAQNIPQIAVVMGSCTAGGAYVPAMADVSIMVKNQATIFLGGPPLVRAATGEKVTAEELGGAYVHCHDSGVSDYFANNDEHALQIAREAVANLNRHKHTSLSTKPVVAPAHNAKDLLGIINDDARHPFDMREIIARIVDGSEFDEFKALYGNTLICGFAHIYGYPVGILANNGILFSESALKGTHFVQLCNERGIPMVFLQNINGFMVGKKYEHKGIAKHGAKMVNAVACSTVPKFTVIVGGSYGAGNYAMCGRAFNPRLLLMWPNAKISVMGGEQAAQVLAQVKLDKMERHNEKWPEQEKQKFMDEIRSSYEQQANVYYASSRCWDDGVINPLDTRKILGQSIAMSLNAPIYEAKYGVFRM